MASSGIKTTIFLLFLAYFLVWVEAQGSMMDNCSGVYLNYQAQHPRKTFPLNVTPIIEQPFVFNSTLTVLNTGKEDVKAWRVFVAFQYGEELVSMSNAVIDDGTILPANVSNGTFLLGSPLENLKTAIETAGDLNQIQVQIQMSGVEFGLNETGFPLPAQVRLANDGFTCGDPNNNATGKLLVLTLPLFFHGSHVFLVLSFCASASFRNMIFYNSLYYDVSWNVIFFNSL